MFYFIWSQTLSLISSLENYFKSKNWTFVEILMLISSIHRRYLNYEIILNVRSQIGQNLNNYFVSFEVLQRSYYGTWSF